MLVGLHGLDKVGGVYQTLMSSSVQPGKALTQKFHVQGLVFQIDPVQVRNLQFPALAGL